MGCPVHMEARVLLAGELIPVPGKILSYDHSASPFNRMVYAEDSNTYF